MYFAGKKSTANIADELKTFFLVTRFRSLHFKLGVNVAIKNRKIVKSNDKIV